MNDFDVIIVGAGIAGASVAAELGAHAKVLLLEAEPTPGFHATGRSAAFWSECYGGAGVQSLTLASGEMLAHPPSDFADRPFVTPRGALHIEVPGSVDLTAAMLCEFADSRANICRVDAEAIQKLVPEIKPEWSAGVWEPDCCDIDVAALHSAYLRKARIHSVQVQCNARVTGATLRTGKWNVATTNGNFTGTLLVNAAGAWADDLAEMANVKRAGITPLRRSIVQVDVGPGVDPAMPLVIGLDASFYFKANGDGSIWLSPHDETPAMPGDAAPEELDIATAIHRFEQVTNWKVSKIQHKWAGLRSFALDRLPVIGRDADCSEFFWLAGQGGFGIQTAPAAARLAAAQILGTDHQMAGVNADNYRPARLR